jgi:hypothetical protein
MVISIQSPERERQPCRAWHGIPFLCEPTLAVSQSNGLAGMTEGYCPLHFSDMSEAVEALCERKFRRGGPFHPDTPGPSVFGHGFIVIEPA